MFAPLIALINQPKDLEKIALPTPIPVVQKAPAWTMPGIWESQTFALSQTHNHDDHEHEHEKVDSKKALNTKLTVIERNLDVVPGQRKTISIGEILKQPNVKGVFVITIGEGCPHADHNQRFLDAYAKALDSRGVKTIILFNCTESGAKKFFDRYQSPVAFAVDGQLKAQSNFGLEFSNAFISFKADGSVIGGKTQGVKSYKFLSDGNHPFVQPSLDAVITKLLGEADAKSIKEEVAKSATSPIDFELGCPLGKCTHGG